jgi:hypothetical protein
MSRTSKNIQDISDCIGAFEPEESVEMYNIDQFFEMSEDEAWRAIHASFNADSPEQFLIESCAIKEADKFEDGEHNANAEWHPIAGGFVSKENADFVCALYNNWRVIRQELYEHRCLLDQLREMLSEQRQLEDILIASASGPAAN